MDTDQSTTSLGATEQRNISAILELERAHRELRSGVERFTDWVSASAGSTPFIVIHLVWFAIWIGANAWRGAFDPFPYALLTLIVSLEAILLTAFILMTENRATKLAEKRAHLDLQVNLLAEQESTAILRLLCLLAERAGIDVAQVDPRLDQFRLTTNVRTLSVELDAQLNPAQQPEAAASRPPTVV